MLVVASLPARNELRTGVEYLEQLDTRLAGSAATNPLAVRIPAVFYPEDRTISQTAEGGTIQVVPEGIPWQFYLINTGVRSHDEPARSGGEWILIDLTSPQRFENRAPASDFDSARLQQGEAIAPPIGMFSELNSRIRFPQGRLFFTLPNGVSYRLVTTEPWSLSDWLSAIGMALAAIAIAAAVLATGGAAAPAAVAFYAGVGAAAAAGSTLANLHERRQQGILTSANIDDAMISIAIDVVTALSMGLGRLIALPPAAARIGLTGERFIALQRATQVVRARFAGDVYQAWSLTSGLAAAYRAIENQPGLSDDERSQMRAQLTRRALLTGLLLGVAIRGDVQDLRAGRNLIISHVDADGALVTARPDADVAGPHVDAPGASVAAHAAPHADVTGPVHATSERAGTHLEIGGHTHALAPAGSGRNRDFYFCSDLCAPLVDQLRSVAAALPRNHPFRAAVSDMLNRARRASQRLRRGEIPPEDVDAVARELRERIARLSDDNSHFAALMNTDPRLLAAHAPAIRQRSADALEGGRTHLETQAERQAGTRGQLVDAPLEES